MWLSSVADISGVAPDVTQPQQCHRTRHGGDDSYWRGRKLLLLWDSSELVAYPPGSEQPLKGWTLTSCSSRGQEKGRSRLGDAVDWTPCTQEHSPHPHPRPLDTGAACSKRAVLLLHGDVLLVAPGCWGKEPRCRRPPALKQPRLLSCLPDSGPCQQEGPVGFWGIFTISFLHHLLCQPPRAAFSSDLSHSERATLSKRGLFPAAKSKACFPSRDGCLSHRPFWINF